MKRSFLISTLLLLLFAEGNAQINLALAFNSRPQPYLADWGNSVNGRAIVTAGAGTINTAVKFKAILTDQHGNTAGVTNLQTAVVYALNRLPATNLFTLGDIVPLQSMQFTGAAQNLLQSTGRLAAGTYTLTVQLYTTLDSLIAERFAVLNITGYQLPVLIAPADNTELDARIAAAVITFRWTRLQPVLADLPRYRVQVFEVLKEQTPMQAFRSNSPLLDEESLRGSTQLIWHTNLSMVDSSSNRQFIWTVQTLDAKGEPIPANDMNTQGRAQPAVFTIGKQYAVPALPVKKQPVAETKSN